MIISVERIGKNSWSQVREIWGCSFVVTLFLLRNFWPVCWSIVVEGGTNCWFNILGGVSFWPLPWGEEGWDQVIRPKFFSCTSSYNLYQQISVHHTSKFQELSDATTYLLHVVKQGLLPRNDKTSISILASWKSGVCHLQPLESEWSCL